MFARVDLAEVIRGASGDGVHWTLDDPADLNVNLVHLEPGSGVGAHVNDEVDVLFVGLEGSGHLTVDGDTVALSILRAAVAPKGTRREVSAGASGVAYLTVHVRRGPLGVRR